MAAHTDTSTSGGIRVIVADDHPALKQRPVPPAVLPYSAFSDDVLTLAGTVAGADGVLRKTAGGSDLRRFPLAR